MKPNSRINYSWNILIRYLKKVPIGLTKKSYEKRSKWTDKGIKEGYIRVYFFRFHRLWTFLLAYHDPRQFYMECHDVMLQCAYIMIVMTYFMMNIWQQAMPCDVAMCCAGGDGGGQNIHDMNIKQTLKNSQKTVWIFIRVYRSPPASKQQAKIIDRHELHITPL